MADMSNDELQLRLHSQDFLNRDKGSLSASDGPPPRKPTPPTKSESGGNANSMNRLMTTASNMSPAVNASSLKSDHPYGDGGYSEMPSKTMIRLGAGTGYGSK